MLQGFITHFKAKAALGAQSAACVMVAALAGMIALGFFLGALFVWLSLRFGTIEACLMMGGGFVGVAAGAAIVLAVVRRRPVPPAPNVGAAVSGLMADQAMLDIGLKATRLLRGRGAGSIGLVGAFVVGILLSRTMRK